MLKNSLIYVTIAAAMMITACRKPYDPAPVKANANYLVVEGVINPDDTTTIALSRTVNLSEKVTTKPETGAVLIVEGDQQTSYTLKETPGGIYKLPPQNLDITHKYRLRIKTSDGKEYLSDREQATAAPPIDSVYFSVGANGIQIFADAHDPSNKTQYYRWDFTETWKFETPYISEFRSDTTKIVPRSPDSLVGKCFGNEGSHDILLASTALLKQSVVNKIPIAVVASTSEKLETRYSILLRQYALTGPAYEFWLNLKKNTEQLGSIFDASPSAIDGNIHSVSTPAVPVLGYISVGSVQTKRIFIDNAQLPQTWIRTYPFGCEIDSVKFPANPLDVDEVKIFLINPPIVNVPLTKLGNRGYFYTTVQCGDCTIRGTTRQPAFWR